MTELRIGVTGAAGRMGTTLVRQVQATDGCAIAGAIERPVQSVQMVSTSPTLFPTAALIGLL